VVYSAVVAGEISLVAMIGTVVFRERMGPMGLAGVAAALIERNASRGGGVRVLIGTPESNPEVGPDGSVPKCRIIDWPNRKYRGIFAESRWCSELMTLDDWKAAIDLLASLKFNVLDLGVANNCKEL